MQQLINTRNNRPPKSSWSLCISCMWLCSAASSSRSSRGWNKLHTLPQRLFKVMKSSARFPPPVMASPQAVLHLPVTASGQVLDPQLLIPACSGQDPRLLRLPSPVRAHTTCALLEVCVDSSLGSQVFALPGRLLPQRSLRRLPGQGAKAVLERQIEDTVRTEAASACWSCKSNDLRKSSWP